MPQPFSLTGGNMKYSGVGGQAVMEGVMMKNEDRYAVAVRKPDHTIDVKVSTFKETIKNKKLRRLPFIRGVINFIESLILGMQTLMYSASFFEDDEDEKKKKEAMTQEERKAQEEKEKKQEKAMMGGTVAFSVVFALGLFFFLPYFLSGIFHKVISSDTVIALLEGLIRLAIFIGYIALISLTPDIKRVFMYHGAEHKCINCIEHGMELNVENVRLVPSCSLDLLVLVRQSWPRLWRKFSLMMSQLCFALTCQNTWKNLRLADLTVLLQVMLDMMRVVN